MKCEICRKGPPDDDVTLIRQNEKGVIGIWRCREHNKLPIESDLNKLLEIIERKNENQSDISD